MHRPSAAKLWQMPQATVLPTARLSPLAPLPRSTPLEEHDTSYLAESVKMVSLSYTFILAASLLTALYDEHMFLSMKDELLLRPAAGQQDIDILLLPVFIGRYVILLAEHLREMPDVLIAEIFRDFRYLQLRVQQQLLRLLQAERGDVLLVTEPDLLLEQLAEIGRV
ncbi:hypothetical protein D3C76_1335510 [compost metagenome]